MSTQAQAIQDRLVSFSVAVVKFTRGTRDATGGRYLVAQLLRSASSPAANYAEARDAESHRDFVHKLQICLKELRETSVWLRTIARTTSPRDDLTSLERECDELISIFVASVRTAKSRDAARGRS